MHVLPYPVSGIQILSWFAIGLVSTWGGLIRYILDKRKKRTRWSWREMMTQMMISGFVGFLSGVYSYESTGRMILSFVVAGLSGLAGSNSLIWLKNTHEKNVGK